MNLLIFVTNIGKNLGVISQVIPKVVNDKETFSQVIPIIMDSTSSFCPLHNCSQFKIRNFENDNPPRLKWIFINSLLVEHRAVFK